jgi:hypothetical protein
VNQQALSALLWSVADLLRGDYRQSDYGKVTGVRQPLDQRTRPIAAIRPRSGAALQHPQTGRSCLAPRDRRVTVRSAGRSGR